MSRNARKEKLKKEREEDLRARIADGMIIGQILRTEEKVKELAEEEEPSSARISAYRLLLDSKFRRLAKILPDLKGIDLTADITGQVAVGLKEITDEEWAALSQLEHGIAVASETE